ncbi:hypothetical protein INT45_000576 [Circinella minor]|uniref:F-box domain-containing protein n=1 Tax=Circinella minor TaxID=1195481 RepID=A0A8H7SE59_9FUNG|nr:hypothetical protein INT45_000576 [Circinella minor]
MNYIPPVDFSDLQDLLCNAEDALEEEQYVTAIHKADKAHEELRKVYLDILNIKIKGHLGQGRLVIALNYAETLIKEFPDYIPGFEFIVDILIKQEKLHKAIDMCDNLMTRRRVGKRRYRWDDDADYETLFRLKEYAIQRLNSRCDFMKQLPLDVIALIFDGFSFDMISICMDVSRHWRETLIRTPITNKLHNWNYSMDYDRIGSIQSIQLLGKYLKGLEVRIRNNVPEYVHKKQKYLFQKVSFCQLRSLSISKFKIFCLMICGSIYE